MKKIVCAGAAVIGLATAVLLTILVVTAVRFGEWGRVMVYGILLLLSLELTGVCLFRAFQKRSEH